MNWLRCLSDSRRRGTLELRLAGIYAASARGYLPFMAPGRGLFEQLITDSLDAELCSLSSRLRARRRPLSSADAADRIAFHISAVVERAVAGLPDSDRVRVGIDLARGLIAQLHAQSNDVALDDAPAPSGEFLSAITAMLPDGRFEAIEEPLIPLLDTTLLTNAPDEPRVGRQILTEIESADGVDVVMAFIRRSGIRPFLAGLRRHTSAGRQLRVLTTTYTGSTELEALVELRQAGALVRVSYDTSSTRLHAKAWMFQREAGSSTAYIGSSNLTHAAQVSGLEWNVRVSELRNRPVIDKMRAVYETYWHGGDFVDFDADQFRSVSQIAEAPAFYLPPTELRPEPFQRRLLELVAAARQLGRHRNLLVSATGTGKTVMAALDYHSVSSSLPRSRLLFVAHRKEILEQSLGTFRHALRQPSFGELWVGGRRPKRFEHVFASIQSLSANVLSALERDHFDVVIVDEFHHAAAHSYQRLLDHLRPRELLGLTATPERSDGLSLLHFFDGRVAAELRLWDAIDQQRLAPFVYYGIHDGLDLSAVPWRRGRGYDALGLTNLLTANDAWARLVIQQLKLHVGDLSRMRALGYCVSIEHARYMQRVFAAAGIAAVAVWGDSSESERTSALEGLRHGRVQIVFSVDLFNEGVDLPLVDTLLLLRPTDSGTLFLQQIGRGLRRAAGKTVCTVLDFVGHHRKEFRYDRRFRALLGGTRKQLERQIQDGFPFLPAGCHMELDDVAADIVLRNIKASIPSLWKAKIEELQAQAAASAATPRLADFLRESELEPEDVYAGNKSWSDLLAAAGLHVLPSGPSETPLRRAVGRLLHLDDALRLDSYREFLAQASPPVVEELTPQRQRLLRMLIASLVDQVVRKEASLSEACTLLWRHPQVLAELRQLLDVLGERVDRVTQPLRSRPSNPLRIHARYTRLEILAGFGVGHSAKIAAWQTGVYYLAEASADLLAFTLDKSSAGFSPTTRYRDYAISPTLIHWESQSSVRAAGPTGTRYQRHSERESDIMLFARVRNDERAFWFLGPAVYVEHRGERPMAVTWRLRTPLPGDLYARFAAAVA